MKNQFKVGDLVRVTRHGAHGIKFGAVCELLSLDFWGNPHNPTAHVSGTTATEWAQGGQLVEIHALKLAKQAMRKRDEYANRRG